MRNHHHHISVMGLGHLLTRSDLTYPEVSSKVCHDSFCQLENSVSLPWVIYYEAFYLHVGLLLGELLTFTFYLIVRTRCLLEMLQSQDDFQSCMQVTEDDRNRIIADVS